MEVEIPYVRTILINAIVEQVHTYDSGASYLRILQETGQMDAWSWLPSMGQDTERVLKAEVCAMPLETSEGETHVVTRIQPRPELDVFNLIPDQFGKRDDIVFRCRDVVDACESEPLRRFLSNVFSMPAVYRNFWKCQASKAHHHAYAGGLAVHSIEMAENVRDTPRLTGMERDVGIAHALTHDVGKLWCYAEGGAHLYALGHELVGLAQLHGALERLGCDWPDGAVAMRSLLSGQWKRHGGKPLMAVGSLVRAYDQASAENDLRLHGRHPHRPWSPSKPSGDNVLTFRR